MGNFWDWFCDSTNPHFFLLTKPSSCVNHAFIICFDILLLVLLLFNIMTRTSAKKSEVPARYRPLSVLQKSSLVYNGCLGFVYIGLSVWNLVENLRFGHSISPIHWWVLYLFQGFTWFFVGLMVSLKGNYFPRVSLKILAMFAFLSSGIFCVLSVFATILDHGITIKVVLDVMSFLGGSLLLLCAYKGYNNEVDRSSTLYTSLNNNNGGCEIDSDAQISPFSNSGLLSRLTFWWLNPLMKLGKEKIIDEEDIPILRDEDRAEVCYLQFMDRLNKQKKKDPNSESMVLWAIVKCYGSEILNSGLFAILKVITVSSGPVLLNAFVEVAEGKQAFKYEGYILASVLFITKLLESLSQRQWYFRTRLIGLKTRSILISAIYKKQLRLSNVARMKHSAGKIMNYVSVDAYRVGEFPFWFHQTWATCLQLCIALAILVHAVGLATIAALIVILITILINSPLSKLQHKALSQLMAAQDARLKACSEALVNMKVLKLYAWETHFKSVIDGLRKVEIQWLRMLHSVRSYNALFFWSNPLVVSAATFLTCYFLGIPLHASNVFTFVATLRLVTEPIRSMPDVITAVIQARVAFGRIVDFLEEPELQSETVRKKSLNHTNHAILIKSANLSWEIDPPKPTLRDIKLIVKPGEKVAICGEVGSGKSTLLAAILGEVPYIKGTVEVYGRIAYVSQTAWIQTGTIRQNILFGSAMDERRYQETLRRCSLVKDFELLPYSDMTVIGERGVNLSGGQKQRIQLARALYQDADVYLLDDPFSAVDAHTATSLFNDYILEALYEKTVLLVTHQVDFLPAFHRCLLMLDGEIIQSGAYHQLLASSREFSELVNAHKETAGNERLPEVHPSKKLSNSTNEIKITDITNPPSASEGDQLIKKEERETGDTGLRPYLLYLNQNKGFFYLSICALGQIVFAIGQISQNYWMASGIDNSQVSTLKLIVVYVVLGACSLIFLVFRNNAMINMGVKASTSIFSRLLSSLFRAPMAFYDSVPVGRILSRISSDLSIVDIDVPMNFAVCVGSAVTLLSNIGVLAFVTWQVLLVSIPVIYLAFRLQKYYLASAKELMRVNGTTKSYIANHLAESIAGSMTIRAFEEEDRFFSENLNVIDKNASPFFHNFAANEWLIQRLETLCALILASAAFCMVSLPTGTFSSGFIGMALSYGLSLNVSMVTSMQNQCALANYIVSFERLDQYMHIHSEAPEVIDDNRPPRNWPLVGKVEICNLQVKYRPDTLVLRGISCTFEGGDKIGIVGRTGSGKSTLLGALFRLVEPCGGTITVDGIDICSIGLHDLRSRFGIIPQDPTLFNGTVRFNLDPLCQHNDQEIWKVIEKCQLKEAVQEKDQGLDSLVMEDGSNWSMGQRQLFCLGRALLRRSKVLMLDEATASIDNATDMVLQKIIRSEFADCTVITVAHRIPTVMDCTKVLAISDGELVEYDEPMKLMKNEGSLFGQLVKEYWSHSHSTDQWH